MALFSRRVEDTTPVVSPQDEFLAEMPARVAEIAAAAQRAGDALRFHLDQMARQRSEEAEDGPPPVASGAYEEVARALVDRVRTLRGEAKELATVLERSAWHLAALRSEEGKGEESDASAVENGRAGASEPAGGPPLHGRLRGPTQEPGE